jgi:predicted ATP-grasp superfamily ATP-dependent carboligase
MTTTPARERLRPGLAADRTGAVVVGGDYQGLGIVRSLGRRGVPVMVVDDEPSIARYSRYAAGHRTVPDLHDPARALESLLELGRQLQPQRWVLFPTREETVVLVAEHRDVLSRLFRIPTPGMDVIRAAWDKRETYRISRALGVPTPRFWLPSTRAELDEVDLSAPVVVKPAIKENFIYATGVKAWRADDKQQLVDAYERALRVLDPSEIIVQEMIPGGGHRQLSYCAFFKDGLPVATMTTRRLRQHPSDFGRASTYVRTERLPELAAPSERFLRTIDYYGLVEMEYKVDPRDDTPKLLDVNARTWGYHTLGAAAGVDFADLLYRDQIGASVHGGEARDGVGWLRWSTDLPNAGRDLWHRQLHAREYLRSLRQVDTEAVLSLHDPLPGLAEVVLLPSLAWRRGL